MNRIEQAFASVCKFFGKVPTGKALLVFYAIEMFTKLAAAVLVYLACSLGVHGILNGIEVHYLDFDARGFALVHIGAKEGREFALCNGVLISYR